MLLAGGAMRADAQLGGTMFALSQKPTKFTCVLLTGNGVQLTGGGVNLCQ
jgi:hypothetical protein